MENYRGNSIYEIQVRGMLDESWQQWFNSEEFLFQSTKDHSTVTKLVVTVADQSALRGILGKLWDLNLTLISLHLIEIKSEEVNNEF